MSVTKEVIQAPESAAFVSYENNRIEYNGEYDIQWHSSSFSSCEFILTGAAAMGAQFIKVICKQEPELIGKWQETLFGKEHVSTPSRVKELEDKLRELSELVYCSGDSAIGWLIDNQESINDLLDKDK